MKSRKALKVEICDYFTRLGADKSKLIEICQFIKDEAQLALSVGWDMTDADLIEAIAQKFSDRHHVVVLGFIKDLIEIEKAVQEHLESQRWWKAAARDDFELEDFTPAGEIEVSETAAIVRPYGFCKGITARLPRGFKKITDPADFTGREPWWYECSIKDLDVIKKNFPDFEVLRHPGC